MTTSTRANIIRRYYAAYETKQRTIIDDLLTRNFTFTSPLDDAINRDTYFARCWPNSTTTRRFTLEAIVDNGAETIVQYRLETTEDKQFRNMEILHFDGDKIAAIEVYFGRTL
jgi:ketosteroid isomerase-like protein